MTGTDLIKREELASQVIAVMDASHSVFVNPRQALTVLEVARERVTARMSEQESSGLQPQT